MHAHTHIYQRLSISQFSWCLSLSSPVFLSPSLCVSSSPLQVKEYDYYGVYDYKKNQNYKYKELLSREYTFDFPKHHDIVSGGEESDQIKGKVGVEKGEGGGGRNGGGALGNCDCERPLWSRNTHPRGSPQLRTTRPYCPVLCVCVCACVHVDKERVSFLPTRRGRLRHVLLWKVLSHWAGCQEGS